MSKKPSATPEEAALMGNDVRGWAHICEMRGDLLPSDNDVLEDMFLQRKLTCAVVPMAERQAAREHLNGKGVIKAEDHPLTPLEKLNKKKAKVHTGNDVKKMLKDGGDVEEYVLIYQSNNARNSDFFKVQHALSGELDLVRSSVWQMELYVLGKEAKGQQKKEPAKHIKFLLDTDDWQPDPNKEYIFRIVYNVA